MGQVHRTKKIKKCQITRSSEARRQWTRQIACGNRQRSLSCNTQSLAIVLLRWVSLLPFLWLITLSLWSYKVHLNVWHFIKLQHQKINQHKQVRIRPRSFWTWNKFNLDLWFRQCVSMPASVSCCLNILISINMKYSANLLIDRCVITTFYTYYR